MRRRRPSPPAETLDEDEQDAAVSDLEAQAAASTRLAGKAVAAVLLCATAALFAPRTARRWEFGRPAADALDALAVASLALSAWAAVTPQSLAPTAAVGIVASALQASALATIQAPAPRAGWQVVLPLACAAAAPVVGTGVVAVLRALSLESERGLEELKRARYRHRTV